MKTQKHTPGPWHIGLQGGIYQNKTGAQVCIYDMATNFDDENLANARLIAAAPELLAALELAESALCEIYGEGGPLESCERPFALHNQIVAAIQKAKGEA